MSQPGIQIFRSFDDLLQETRLPLVTVYFSPDDFRDLWVARLFDIEKATPYFALANTYKEILSFKPAGMEIIQREALDTLSIVEVWI